MPVPSLQTRVLLKAATKDSDVMAVIGVRGSFRLWATDALKTLSPLGFSAQHIGTIITRHPPLLRSRPRSIAHAFQDLQALFAGAGDPPAPPFETRLHEALVAQPSAFFAPSDPHLQMRRLVRLGAFRNVPEAAEAALARPRTLLAAQARMRQLLALRQALELSESEYRAALAHGSSIEKRVLPRLVAARAVECASSPCPGFVPYPRSSLASGECWQSTR